jgi:23S rRNA pseudouridine1911/1915/1917 synthase
MSPDPDSQRQEVTVGAAEAGRRLDRLLAERLGGLSRSRLKGLIEAGMVSAGGATITEPSTRVKPGQTFAIVARGTGARARYRLRG